MIDGGSERGEWLGGCAASWMGYPLGCECFQLSMKFEGGSTRGSGQLWESTVEAPMVALKLNFQSWNK